jgi:hypothetical protein
MLQLVYCGWSPTAWAFRSSKEFERSFFVKVLQYWGLYWRTFGDCLAWCISLFCYVTMARGNYLVFIILCFVVAWIRREKKKKIILYTMNLTWINIWFSFNLFRITSCTKTYRDVLLTNTTFNLITKIS